MGGMGSDDEGGGGMPGMGGAFAGGGMPGGFSMFMGGMPGGMGGASAGAGLGGAAAGGARRGGRPAGPVQAEPIKRQLLCTLEELYSGCTKRIKITRQRVDPASGVARPDEKVLEINVKPGALLASAACVACPSRPHTHISRSPACVCVPAVRVAVPCRMEEGHRHHV